MSCAQRAPSAPMNARRSAVVPVAFSATSASFSRTLLTQSPWRCGTAVCNSKCDDTFGSSQNTTTTTTAAAATTTPVALFGLGRRLRAREEAWRLRLWEAIAKERVELHEHVSAERYMEAARSRDRLYRMRLKDPYERTRHAMHKAAAQSRFRRAASLRDSLSQLAPPPVVLDDPTRDFDAWRVRARKSTSACVVTKGLSVHVRSVYDECRSAPQQGRLAVFRSTLRVTNASDKIVQIIGRRWRIASFVELGDVKDVEGCGLGASRIQPVLVPGDTYTFQSAAPVRILGLVRAKTTTVPVAVAVASTNAQSSLSSSLSSSGDNGIDTGNEKEQRDIAVGSIGGVLEVVSGDCGEERWDATIGETVFMLPA